MFKTLLFKDNLIYRSVLKSALLNRYNDLEVKEAAGEHEALSVVDSYAPDLIIMDIDLHYGANGLDLSKKIKVEHPVIVVVILSQNDIPEYRSVAQQNGTDFFLKALHLTVYLIMWILLLLISSMLRSRY